jgi:hypothetical protein
MRLKVGDLVQHDGLRGYVQLINKDKALVWTRTGSLKIFNIYGTYLSTYTKRRVSGKINKRI